MRSSAAIVVVTAVAVALAVQRPAGEGEREQPDVAASVVENPTERPTALPAAPTTADDDDEPAPSSTPDDGATPRPTPGDEGAPAAGPSTPGPSPSGGATGDRRPTPAPSATEPSSRPTSPRPTSGPTHEPTAQPTRPGPEPSPRPPAPPRPTDVVTAATDDQVVVRFADASGGHAAHEVLRSGSKASWDGGGWAPSVVVATLPPGVDRTLLHLAPGRHRFTVRAVVDGVASPPSDPVEAIAWPGRPTSLHGEAVGPGRVALRWTHALSVLPDVRFRVDRRAITDDGLGRWTTLVDVAPAAVRERIELDVPSGPARYRVRALAPGDVVSRPSPTVDVTAP